MIEVDPRFVNISSIFEILFFIFELKREVLADCCKTGSRNAIPIIFGAKCGDSAGVSFFLIILVFLVRARC